MSKARKIIDNLFIGFIFFIQICGLVIVLLPFIPSITFALFPTRKIEYIPTNAVLAKEDNIDEEKFYVTNGNRIVIEKIGVDTKILEGENENVMLFEEGAWRDPRTSTPGAIGNMVIGGHRFQYLPPNTTTFYNLDKLEITDIVLIYWEGREYRYRIHDIFEVTPSEVWILNQNTEIEELTIYTCTPVYSSTRRLVVKASRV